MINFTVPGNPTPWERARSRFGARFTAPATRKYQDRIRAYAVNAKARPISGPVTLQVNFYRKDAQPCDLDNLAKSVADALQGFAFANDRQIVKLSALKSIDRENPRTEIQVDAA